MAKPTTVADLIARAVTIAEQIEAIEGDTGLQRLSRKAWLAKAKELAGGADLEQVRAKAGGRRHLLALVEQTAELQLRAGQDRPAVAHIFDDPQREPGAFSERLAAGISLEEASALVALRVAEMRPAEAWGRLDDFGQRDAALAPLRDELRLQLDQRLAVDTRVADLAWMPSGAPAINLPGGGQLMISEENATMLASAAAAMVRIQLINGARLAA